MTRYAELVRGWPTDDALPQGAMDVLVEVGQLFIIKGDALKYKLSQAQGQDALEMKAYIRQREDAGSVDVQAALGP